jgi:hypothetical protein
MNEMKNNGMFIKNAALQPYLCAAQNLSGMKHFVATAHVRIADKPSQGSTYPYAKLRYALRLNLWAKKE